MKKLILSTFMSLIATGALAQPAGNLPACCTVEYLEEPEETWNEVIFGGSEPRSALAAAFLGWKIGLVIVAPIVAPVTYFAKGTVRETVGITALSALAGAPAFVEFFYGLGKIGRYFGWYNGLTPEERPYRYLCNCPQSEIEKINRILSH
jgi:hypothetical protein